MISLRLLQLIAFLVWTSGAYSLENQQPFFQLSAPWAWRCSANKTCEKVERSRFPAEGMSLMACKLTCGKYGMLWPRPRLSTSMSKTLVAFMPTGFQVAMIAAPTAASKSMMEEAVSIFMSQLHAMVPSYAASCSKTSGRLCTSTESKLREISVEIAFTSASTVLSLSTNESYTLSVGTTDTKTTVYIVAETFFGARHALETLSQLIAWDDVSSALVMTSQASISDSPFYPHRGLLIDTSRNFISLPVLKRIVDGMSYNKLNSFHWHLTDTHSFPFVSRRNPLLTLYGAYSPNHVYTPHEVEELVHYAMVRGVKIIPEFDAPSHVGNGWQWGPLYGMGDLALCINEEPWQAWCVEPPCGQLNPVNDNVYSILGDIYKDLADVFQSDMFHMGGDEVKMDCWNKTQDILDWLQDNGRNRTMEDFVYLWSMFQNRSLVKADESFPTRQIPILWTSELTRKGRVDKYLDKDRYVIHYWETYNSTELHDLYTHGYKMIISNYDALYLDCGYSAWVGEGHNWCSPYKGWQLIYENSPKRMIENFNEVYVDGKILGSEATMWAEQTDSATVESKLWPRGAALAERLWSEPKENWREAEYRMVHHRQRLVERGIPADALQPLWCHHNEGLCYL